MHNPKKGFHISEDLSLGSEFRDKTGQYSFNKYVLSGSYVPGTVLRLWGIPTHKNPGRADSYRLLVCLD